MALNVTFDGYCYLGDGSLSNSNVAYQAYFYKANAGSSTSTWNSTRIVEATGYWNINLGDGDWLGQDGTALSGDVIIVVFWSPTTSDRTDICSLLTEWSCFRIILDGSSTYTNNTQIKSNICPNLSWSMQSTGYVDTSVSITNSSSDTHQWDFSGNTMYQRDTWYTTLMNINSVDNTDYDYDDGNQEIDLAGAANTSHSWTSSGDYTVEIVIEDDCGCTVTGTDTIRIYNNPPVPDITMTPASPDPNEVITFQYTGTDVDDTITNIAWTINDSGAYGNTDTTSATNARDDIIPHSAGLGTDWSGQSGNVGAFTNPGSHLVEITYEYWDGFATITGTYSESFTQGYFSGPVVSFTQDPTNAVVTSGVSFTNTSTNTDRVGLGLPEDIEYTWTWDDNGDVDVDDDKPFSFVLTKYPTTAICSVELCAEWSDGWETQTTCTSGNVVFETTVTVTQEECYYELEVYGTSDDGSITGYGWTVYSGPASTGPWTETWSSPVNMDQQYKGICFSDLGYYKIEGSVYGTGATTSDYEVVYVSEVCPEGQPGRTVVICPPDVTPHHFGDKKVRGDEIKPGMRGRMDLQPSVRIVHNDNNKPFPGPINI